MFSKSFKLFGVFILVGSALSAEAPRPRWSGYDRLDQDGLVTTNLTLDEAICRTLQESFDLSIADQEALSRSYEVTQASLPPNPVFSYEAEDFAGNDGWRGWNHREQYFIYSQLVETAGKRCLRTEAASFRYYASLVEYDISKLFLLNKVHRAFIAVVAAQELVKLNREYAGSSQELLHITTKKLDAGKVSPMQKNKAEVAYSAALISIEEAERDLGTARKRLALLWNQGLPHTLERAVYPFYEFSQPKPFEEYLSELCEQPEMRQALFAYLSANKIWQLEKANSVPDVTVQVGYKTNGLEKRRGMVAGFSIPIPVLNQNQGNIGRAYSDMLKVNDEKEQLKVLLESKLSLFYEELQRAYQEASRIKNSTLSTAEETFNLAQQGYQEGKFEYLEVLDAHRTLYEIRLKYIQVLVNYHTRQADINYLNSQAD